jgi:Uma2 family endonuclease
MRYEVVKGELFMSPTPRAIHQEMIVNLVFELHFFLKKKQHGKVLVAPLDVILGDLATPVQPDIIFIRQERLSIVRDKIEGVPDIVIEVLSPGSVGHDRRRKFALYAEAGVPEYWLADPDECLVEVYVLRGQAYAILGQFVGEDAIQSEVLPDLHFSINSICPA